MAEKNYVKGSLTALLRIIERSTSEKQPSDAVLRAFLDLLALKDSPTAQSLKKHEAIHAETESRLRRLENQAAWTQRPAVRSMRRTGGGTFDEEE